MGKEFLGTRLNCGNSYKFWMNFENVGIVSYQLNTMFKSS
ncbi:hypothetical protein LEP1GSC170_4311 [Leptospira interrogans serovar Bataviae str. HAI135]|uniref:Uncharacterized protein n=1 Tax=Leptospira noguchii serovar Autumnalis str. ZUN142 TaxID=1085540 RepID=M6U986_9LEPT|nr:hypothetical protein LEP1GSC170_4311 [Leptospira interrogans serovar Bataviae str. HAI135]EMO41055.1 hypothetical protein LEP1GSC186_4704 [Leptospira noguchii serovar Autumnalis str. ZUN142]